MGCLQTVEQGQQMKAQIHSGSSNTAGQPKPTKGATSNTKKATGTPTQTVDPQKKSNARTAASLEETTKTIINSILNQQAQLKLVNEDDDDAKLDNLGDKVHDAMAIQVVPAPNKLAKRCYLEVNLKAFHANLEAISIQNG